MDGVDECDAVDEISLQRAKSQANVTREDEDSLNTDGDPGESNNFDENKAEDHDYKLSGLFMMHFYPCIRRLLFISCFLFSFLSLQSQQEHFCGIRNHSMQDGEKLTYKIYYTLAGVYVGAGEVVFSTKLETYQSKPVYHVSGYGYTYKSYDWFYKVNDLYESYIDTATMLPVKFVRNVHEQNNQIYSNVLFNHAHLNAITTNGLFTIPSCAQDVLSAIYYARNINYNQYKIGDKIPFSIFLDDQVFNIFIRYLGKETINTKWGTFRTIKFKPLLIDGTIFKGGEQMTVWVTDDENKIPLLVETPILIGKVKVYLNDFNHLRNAQSARINSH